MHPSPFIILPFAGAFLYAGCKPKSAHFLRARKNSCWLLVLWYWTLYREFGSDTGYATSTAHPGLYCYPPTRLHVPGALLSSSPGWPFCYGKPTMGGLRWFDVARAGMPLFAGTIPLISFRQGVNFERAMGPKWSRPTLKCCRGWEHSQAHRRCFLRCHDVEAKDPFFHGFWSYKYRPADFPKWSSSGSLSPGLVRPSRRLKS